MTSTKAFLVWIKKNTGICLTQSQPSSERDRPTISCVTDPVPRSLDVLEIFWVARSVARCWLVLSRVNATVAHHRHTTIARAISYLRWHSTTWALHRLGQTPWLTVIRPPLTHNDARNFELTPTGWHRSAHHATLWNCSHASSTWQLVHRTSRRNHVLRCLDSYS